MKEIKRFAAKKTVCVDILAEDLDSTIQKVRQLVELLEKANSLARELASVDVALEIKF